jgi:hypothetical protein
MYEQRPSGKDNFAADRQVGDQIIAALPAAQAEVRAQRDVLARVVRYLPTGPSSRNPFLQGLSNRRRLQILMRAARRATLKLSLTGSA